MQFERIFALTQGTPWRVDGLRAAARLTGLEIEEPRQVPISDQVVEAFEGFGNDKRPGYGAARAWLGHINLLQHIMQSNLATALILEDDVDWDIAVRDQMPVIADAVRNISQAPIESPDPYGSNWDVLWLGHCGAWTDGEPKEHIAWPDETVIPHKDYKGFGEGAVKSLPEGYRTLRPTSVAVCSFAYGVSYAGVPKLLAALNHGADEAFDVALSTACRSDDTLRCYTVNPEIMHHYKPDAKDGLSSEVDAGNDGKDIGAAGTLGKHMGTTVNIANSARCKALWHRRCLGTRWRR